MLSRSLTAAIVCIFARLAAAQAQLQFVWPSYGIGGSLYSYSRALPLSNGDTLLIGTNRTSQTIGLLQGPTQHARIVLAASGPVPFANAFPASALPVLGGSGNDMPQAAAIDASGNIWIAGSTDSDDFNLVNPIVSRKVPYRTAAFVLELDPTGTKLLFATYLAGQKPPLASCSVCYYETSATAIAIDPQGNVYVGGSTNEADFPTTPGAFLSNGEGGADTFGDTVIYSWVVKISPAGKLVYSTFIGTGASKCSGGSSCISHQSASASINSLSVDHSGILTLAGVKAGSYNFGSGYVARLTADGSRLLWSSTVGENYGWVPALLMAQDASGVLDLFGGYSTVVTNIGLPSTAGAPGLFAEKLSPDGSTVISSIDLGQSADVRLAGIALDASGNAYLAGTSSSAQFPVLPGVPNLGSDFILGLDSSGVKPNVLLRFPRGTVSAPLSFDPSDHILLPGSTGTLLTISLTRVLTSPGIVAIANSASYDLNGGLIGGELISLFGFDFGQNPQVLIDSLPATVLYAGANQVNVQVPFELPFGLRQIKVVSSAGSAEVDNLPTVGSLGIFTNDGVHAAALNQDGSVNSAANPAASGSIVTLFGTGAIWPPGIQDGAIASSAMSLSQEVNRFLLVDLIGAPANILYAGTAPGLPYGVFQLNVQVPSGAVSPLTLLQLTNPIWLSATSNPVRIYLK